MALERGSVQLCFILDTMTPRLRKLEVERKRINDHRDGRSWWWWGEENPSTSVLSLYAAITKPQVGPCTNLSLLGKAACRNVSRLWLFNMRARGNTLSPLSDSTVSQGHTNIDSGGTKKQVAQHVNQGRQLPILQQIQCCKMQQKYAVTSSFNGLECQNNPAIHYRARIFLSKYAALFEIFPFVCVSGCELGFRTFNVQVIMLPPLVILTNQFKDNRRLSGGKGGVRFAVWHPIILLHWNLSG